MKALNSGRQLDPTEFKPANVASGEEVNYYMAILPFDDEDDVPIYRNGQHWINRKSYECPRIHNDIDCPLCTKAFDTMKQYKEKEKRSNIAKTLLSKEMWAINVYMLDSKSNPENVRGKVMWWNSKYSVQQIFQACVESNPATEDGAFEPVAGGAFWDYKSGYIFNLKVKSKNGYNNYEASKFVATKHICDVVKKEDWDKAMESKINLSEKFEDENIDFLIDFSRSVDTLAAADGTFGQSDDNNSSPPESPPESSDTPNTVTPEVQEFNDMLDRPSKPKEESDDSEDLLAQLSQ